MKVTYRNKRFEFIGGYEDRYTPKEAGYRWDSHNKVWYAATSGVAEKLEELFDAAAVEAIEKHKQSLSMSSAATADIDIPAPEGLQYMPFQRAGVQYALGRENTLIADEMGLGKTIQCIGIINITNPKSVLVVCPALLKLNWRNELQKWLTNNYRIDILSGTNGNSKTGTSYVNTSADVRGTITIINYDILQSYTEIIKQESLDMLICDESHYIKSSKAQRTKAVAEIAAVAKRKIFLTGTPILNRPNDLFPMLKMFRHPLAGNYIYFIKKFCDAEQNRWGGWDLGYPGKAQAAELQEQLRQSVMVRRMKADVLKELPPKTRQVIAIEPDSVLRAKLKDEQEMQKELKKRKAELQKQAAQGFEDAINQLRAFHVSSLAEISKYRYQTALAKLPHAEKYLDDLLESVDKVVIFCYHKDIAKSLHDTYKDKSVIITGDHSTEQRQAAVESFQNDDNVKVFVGTIGAASQGITLTASSNVVFVELDWSPTIIQQAEDRCHRIGQHDNVTIHYFVVDGSIDSKLAKTHVRKLSGITAITDTPIDVLEDE